MSQADDSDEVLYAAYQRGDMTAFDVLYSRYQQTLYLFLLRRGLSESQAQDAFHDCWIKLIVEQQHFDGLQFRAWIFRVARNMSIDYFRRSAVRNSVSDDEVIDEQLQAVSSETIVQDRDCLHLLKYSIGQLPFEQRDAFLMQQEAGLSLQQIAEVMCVGRETIKSRLRYAMQQLKKMLEDCI
jgi:RNA polymerase sigma-70 factor (ECF subfamily)